VAAVSQSILVGLVLDGKYRIDRELGRGGMGSVYLATHLGTDRPVALKVIAPQFMRDEEFVERFRREAKAAGRLYHPNVVNVTDFGFASVGVERVAYLVMEYLEGCALAEILSEESNLSIEWVIDILEQTCSAVDQAHRLGIIHRDLKPDNIWLVPNRRGGYTVKVLDFGLAKLADKSAEGSGEASSGKWSSSPHLVSGSQAPFRSQGAPQATSVARDGTEDGDALEAITQVQQPSRSEGTTELQSTGGSKENGPEADTQILPSKTDEEVTQVDASRTTAGDELEGRLTRKTMNQAPAAETAAADGLTRIGSIVGTPLYMSPEQCLSKPLDARSDIYSLGVIAYQMLAGRPPFRGQTAEVIKQHIEAPVPSLREARPEVPKRMAKLVMSALSKDPAQRPERAAGFASAMRASGEGTGKLFRRALSLYTEHFPIFFKLSLLLNLPIIGLTTVQFVNELLSIRGVVSAGPIRIANGLLSLLMVAVNFFAASIITGVTIRMVTQVFLAPQRPLELRVAYGALRKRLRALLITGFISGLRVVLGMILGVIPGLWMFLNYSLAAPVVMMEDLKGRAALRRSKALVSRSRRTVIAVAFIEWALPSFAAGLTGALFGGLLKAWAVQHAPQLAGGFTGIVTTLLNVFFIPLLATMTALLYLKTRQVGGETLEEALGLFEEEDVPRRRWQQRMRDRLHSSTPSE
jgi:serine/threonine protein kinase